MAASAAPAISGLPPARVVQFQKRHVSDSSRCQIRCNNGSCHTNSSGSSSSSSFNGRKLTPFSSEERATLLQRGKYISSRPSPSIAAWRIASAADGESGFLVDPSSSPPSDSSSGSSRTPLLVAAAAALLIIAASIGTTVLSTGAAAGLIDSLSKSGFVAAFSLIFVSEIGDKTFFIAALLAMRHSRTLVLLGSVSALAIMSAVSAGIGYFFRSVPSQLQTTIPVGEYLACALLLWFGFLSIRSALQLPSTPQAAAAAGGVGGVQGEEEGELAEARETIEEAERGATIAAPAAIFWEAFSLVFLAEWGDRSMLATIALGAAQSPVGVALGASVGHLLATGLAVVGGSLLSKHISERLVGLIGGVLFLVFAAATLTGIF